MRKRQFAGTKIMASLPSQSSLRTLPLSSVQNASLVGSPDNARSYGATDSREDSGGSLVPPVIDDSEVAVEGGGYMSRSLDTMRRSRARKAAGFLQDREMESDREDEWFEIANPERRRDHLTSDLQTFIHLLKGNVGTGLLAMPLAVKNAGYILGPVGLLVLGIIATHCMLLLVKCSQHLSKRHGVDSLNYAEVLKFAILERTSNPILATAGLYIVNIFLTITQFGFCAVYFVFIGDSMSRVASSAFGFSLSTQQAIAIILPLVIICCWIRELEALTMFSLIANLCIVFSLAVVLYEIVFQMVGDQEGEMAAVRRETLSSVNFASVPLYFGSAVYAFEGIGMVLPLENKMKNPHHFKSVLIAGMGVVIGTYILFGLLGYLVYGSDICASITLNLRSPTRMAANTVFLIAVMYYAYVTFASFMLQFYVPMDFLEIPFFRLIRLEQWTDHVFYSRPRLHKPLIWTLHTIFRTVVVLLIAALAFGIPDLDGLITLIGAVASATLAFIFPPLLQLLTFWKIKPPCLYLPLCGLSLPWAATVIKCVAIIILGLLGSIFGTVFSILSIVKYFETKDHTCPHDS